MIVGQLIMDAANHTLGTNMIIMVCTASCINNGQHPVIYPDTKLSYNKATDRRENSSFILRGEGLGIICHMATPTLYCGISVTNNVQCLNHKGYHVAPTCHYCRRVGPGGLLWAQIFICICALRAKTPELLVPIVTRLSVRTDAELLIQLIIQHQSEMALIIISQLDRTQTGS